MSSSFSPKARLDVSSVSAETLLAAARRTVRLIAIWSFPLLLLSVALVPWRTAASYGWDFRAFYDAGAQYLHLRSPYVPATLANLTSERNFVYPLPVAALFAPLSLVPFPVAATLFILGSALLLGLALRLLEVRDWRCYAAVFLSLPVQLGLKIGTLSPILAFLIALIWRYRHRTWVTVPALALLVVSKLFLWPVALWFLFTRRFRVVGLAALVSVVAVLAASIPIGLGVLTDYPSLLRAVSSFEAPFSFSVFGLGTLLGLPEIGATTLSIAAGALVLLIALRSARSDEKRAFQAVVLASLVLSPIVWAHYLVLLFVPLALARPRFSPLWLAFAWLGVDGFVLDRRTLIVVATAVVLLMPLQAGVADLAVLARRGRILRVPRVSLPLASAALWVPFVLAAGNAGSAIPAVAALTPVSQHRTQSGSAFLRLLTGGNTVCWRVWTRGIPAGSRAAIVQDAPRERVASEEIDSAGRFDRCSPVTPAIADRLTGTFRKRSAAFSVVVVSPTGRPLLQGPMKRRVDAGAASAAPLG